jgi:hypothetical protein
MVLFCGEKIFAIYRFESNSQCFIFAGKVAKLIASMEINDFPEYLVNTVRPNRCITRCGQGVEWVAEGLDWRKYVLSLLLKQRLQLIQSPSYNILNNVPFVHFIILMLARY